MPSRIPLFSGFIRALNAPINWHNFKPVRRLSEPRKLDDGLYGPGKEGESLLPIHVFAQKGVVTIGIGIQGGTAKCR